MPHVVVVVVVVAVVSLTFGGRSTACLGFVWKGFSTVYASHLVVVVVFAVLDDALELADEVLDLGVGPLGRWMGMYCGWTRFVPLLSLSVFLQILMFLVFHFFLTHECSLRGYLVLGAHL